MGNVSLTKMPLIKWSGSKRKQAPYIVSKFPKYIDTYYECFVGGGSVFHELLKQIYEGNIKCNHIVCSDINKDLINIWNMFLNKDTREELFNYYCELSTELIRRAEIDTTPNHRDQVKKCQSLYYEMRSKYNSYIDNNEYSKERTMIFFWITKTAFNGLIRYNEKTGHFNASFHVGLNLKINFDNIRNIFDSWGFVIDNFISKGGTIEFINDSYDNVINNANKDDLIYMDPPYENTKGMYLSSYFDTDKFWNSIRDLNHKDIKYVLSYDGKTGDDDRTVNVPKDIYKIHEYVESGFSNFKKLKSSFTNKSYDLLKDSLYLNYVN